jgi:signal transduction histidine kinase
VAGTFNDGGHLKAHGAANPAHEFLLGAARQLTASLQLEEIISRTVRLVVPDVADWCVVDMVGGHGSVRRLTAAHSNPERERWARETMQMHPPVYGTGTAAGAAVTGKSMLFESVTPESLTADVPNPEYRRLLIDLGIRSVLSVPLRARGEVVGVMTFAMDESHRNLSPADLMIAEDLARWVSLAMENAALYQEQVQLRRASESLVAEREATLTQMAEGVVICDPKGIVTFMNAAARQYYGEDFSGWDIHTFPQRLEITGRRGEALTEVDNPLVAALDFGKTVRNVDANLTAPDGRRLVLQRSAGPVRINDGELLGAVMTISDVTSERVAEAEKEAFLSGVAHDLRAPLTTIRAYAQLFLRLATDANSDTDQCRLVEKIEEQSRRMALLVDEMLDISRSDFEGPVQLDRQHCDLVSLIREVVEEYAANNSEHDITFSPSIEELHGEWDQRRMSRVVGNLISNAVRYSPQGGPIWVGLNADDRQAELTVQDRGVGIPSGERERIFDRFYRASNVAELVPGTGIGLTGAKQIVVLHGGSIHMDSVENEGTTVIVTLPTQA